MGLLQVTVNDNGDSEEDYKLSNMVLANIGNCENMTKKNKMANEPKIGE